MCVWEASESGEGHWKKKSLHVQTRRCASTKYMDASSTFSKHGARARHSCLFQALTGGLLDFLSVECMEHQTRSLFCLMHSFFCFTMQHRIFPSSFWHVAALTATANSAELG